MAEAKLKKQQMEYIAIGVLVVIALFIGMSRFRGDKGKGKSKSVLSSGKFKEKWKEVEILEKKLPVHEEAIQYAIEAVRSPFKSPLEDKKVVEVSDFNESDLPVVVIQGIIWNSARPQVIIDNKIYNIGDIIELGEIKARVTNITKEGMYLKYKRKEFLIGTGQKKETTTDEVNESD